ncbi:hypothetical protein CR105_14755 [Massilia eurypsychrophila]|uniref:DUF3106 domain-containing protein n=2 Tax=Massilia eurypsychrophila TaxID=1485217 RepID=A0A2G8TE51_9BURK|nr:hypothetical protein CR105_14755 [Massilia eurypsychrophila]
MVLMPTWRSAVNKVTGAHLSFLFNAVVTALAFAGLAGAAGAQAPVVAATRPHVQNAAEKPLWSTLTRTQQIALEPLAGEWDRMDAMRKQKWLEIANRYSSMKPDEQVRVHERMRDWLKLTPEERRVVRENYTRTKKIDPGHKSEEWEKYQQLPEEQKKKLAADAAARGKKQVANLPSAAQSSVKTVEPLKRTPPRVAACPAGTVKNAAAPTPACVMVPAAAPAAVAPVVPTTVTPTPVAPAAPVPNAK